MIQRSLPLTALRRHPDNARLKGEYTKSDLADLMASIKEHGLLQPLVVTKDGDNCTILAGHRRHAALLQLGIETAPCVVIEGDDQEALAVLLTENAQHRAPDPLKEAEAVAKLVEGLAAERHSHDRAAAILGKSVAWVRGRLRLTTLSAAWRAARSDPENPLHEFPVGHLELVAALPEAVQDQVLTECEGWFQEGIPLAADLRRTLADHTRDLDEVPWDLNAAEVVPGAPACSGCPRRDSTQGDLFAGTSNAKGDRCLDAPCFAAKRTASVLGAITKAREKYGDALAVESAWGFQDVPMPEGVPVFQQFALRPLAKSKGGTPVLRLATMGVVYMGKAAARVHPDAPSRAEPLEKERTGPKSMEDRRKDLEKRRLVRALALLRGSLLGQDVDIGTEKHPEKVTPPALGLPSLDDLVGLCLAFGTGRTVDEDDSPPWQEQDADRLTAALKTARGGSERARQRLWNILREPIAKAIQPLPGISHEGTAGKAAVAEAVCGLAAVSWGTTFVAPATEAIPEPRAWTAQKAS